MTVAEPVPVSQAKRRFVCAAAGSRHGPRKVRAGLSVRWHVKSKATLLFLCLVCVCPTGCGGTADTAGTPSVQDDAGATTELDAATQGEAASCSPSSDVAQFVSEWSQTMCEAMASCCTGAGLTFNAAACAQANTSFVLSAMPCGAEVIADRRQACLALAAQRYATCDRGTDSRTDDELDQQAWEACTTAITRHVAPGDPCNNVFDCEPSTEGTSTCLGHDGVSTCQWIVPAAEGEPCEEFSGAAVTHECFNTQGLYCDSWGTQTCLAQGAPGGSCAPNTSPACLDGALCDSTTSTCLAPRALGDNCDTNTCAWDLRCDDTQHQCVQLGTAGAACAGDVDCRSESCVGQKCAPRHHTLPDGFSTCSP